MPESKMKKRSFDKMTKNNSLSTYQKPPSLIKWSGSKRSQSESITRLFPEASRYIELFLGGGSILYNATQHYKECIGNDIYFPLIDIWENVKSRPHHIIDNYESNWKSLQENFPEHYYDVRASFNKTKGCNELLFLSRTCTNGIIRFNNKGEFNNSLHVTRKGMNPVTFARIVLDWSNKLQKTNFTNLDFFAFKDEVKKGDFLYLDPPYANSKNRYIENLDEQKLWDFLELANSKGAKWALSFDGTRGENDLVAEVPKELYKSHNLLKAGNSAVKKVLSSSVEEVKESIYLNY